MSHQNESGKVIWLLISILAIGIVFALSVFRKPSAQVGFRSQDSFPAPTATAPVSRETQAPSVAPAPVKEAPPNMEVNPDTVAPATGPLEVDNEQDADPAAIARRDEEERRLHELRNGGFSDRQPAVNNR